MLTASGSSPLARGTLCSRQVLSCCGRFIPAGAGNTLVIANCFPSCAVHPRWRGEHITAEQTHLSRYGSSPLARGTRINYVLHSVRARFIPAGAGNTRAPVALAALHSVHPRWRGEHFPHSRPSQCALGSSPLARGTRPVLMPAWSSSPVHPRWRGEHGKRALNKAEPDGSSPLARGTPARTSV